MPRFVFLARYRQELPFGGVLAGLSLSPAGLSLSLSGGLSLSLSGGPLSLTSEENYLWKPTPELPR